MTISSQNMISGPYLGNGITTSFDYQFKIFDKSHLQVKLHRQDGHVDVLEEGAGYTVSGVGNEAGGKIVMNAPPVSGEQITITRKELDLENQGSFYAEDMERALDEGVMRDQQLKEKLDRALVVGENFSPDQKDKLVADIGKLGDVAEGIADIVPIKDEIVAVAGVAGEVATIAPNMANILAAGTKAHKWAVEAENVTVNDGVNPIGYSAYHWAAKAQDWAGQAQAIAGVDISGKLDKTGGVITGNLTVNNIMSAKELRSNLAITVGGNGKLLTNGNLQGSVWQPWGHSNAFDAISARINNVEAAIGSGGVDEAAVNALIDAKLNAFKNNPTFTGTLKVAGHIKTTGNISAYATL